MRMSVSRVQIGPAKGRSQSGSSVKPEHTLQRTQNNEGTSLQPASWQSLPKRGTLPSILINEPSTCINETEVQRGETAVSQKQILRVDEISEKQDHRVADTSTRQKRKRRAVVHRAKEETTVVQQILVTKDEDKVDFVEEDLSECQNIAFHKVQPYDDDDQRAYSGGSQRSTASSGYGSLPRTPRPRPSTARPDKSMTSTKCAKTKHSTHVKQNTWLDPDVAERVKQNAGHCQGIGEKEAKMEVKHDLEGKTIDEDRQSDLELFNKLSLDHANLTNRISLIYQLKINFSSANFATGVFDHTGGHISLPRHDISLFIPPGAIEHGQLKTIHLFVPPSNRNQGKPAPIVHCGPTGTTFLDHVMLSFPVEPDCPAAEIVPKFTNTEVGSEEEWQPLLEDEDEDAASIVQNGKCTLFLSHFTGYGAEAKKNTSPVGDDKDDRRVIRVGAFASQQTSNDSLYQMRIRFYDASSDRSERIYSKERDHFGGRLLDDDKRMQIDRRGGDLCVKMNNIARGWKAADISDEDQRLEVRQLLDDPNDIDACCTVRLEKLNPQASISSVWSTISIWQEETHGPTVILKPSDALQMSPTFDASRDTLSPTQTFLHQQDELRPSNRPFPIVPLEVRHEMCVLLDVEEPQGKDWRMLAEKIQINPPTIRWIGRDKSPTNKLLSFWETQNPSGGIVAVQRLCDMCEDIGRPDVKELVEKVLSSGGQGDSGYADSASVSTMSRDASSGSLATLSQSVASESFSETPRAIGLLNSMQVTDV